MQINTQKLSWNFYKYGTISLCMIMRNEEKYLRRCLNSVKNIVDEIIIVDTGSTDNSVNIAKEFGAKIFFQKWNDDFSAPRNLGIKHASCDYILILDPDEIMLPEDFTPLRQLTNDKEYKAFQLITRNYGRNPHELNFHTMYGNLDPTGRFAGYVPSNKTRFFKNGLGITFEGIWHELADYYISRNQIKVRTADVVVHHWFHELNQKNREQKLKFYLRLGEKKIKLEPNSGQAHWELAVSEAIAGFKQRAMRSIFRALRLGFGGHNQYFTLSRILRMLKKEGEANLSFEKGICRLYPNLTHTDPRFKPIQALTK